MRDVQIPDEMKNSLILMKEMMKAKIFYNPNSLFEIRSAIKFYEEIDKKQFNKFVMWEEYNRFMKSLNN